MTTNIFNDHQYLKICSEKTLQTNTKGFFMDFVRMVSESAGEEWIKNVFGKAKSDRERIEFLYRYEGTKKSIVEILSNVQEIYRRKDGKVAYSKSLEAEEAFQKKDIKKSLGLFSLSLIRVPQTDKDNLVRVLWGRAQVLIVLRENSLALTDLQQILKENVPQSRKGEVYAKMGICYKALGEDNKAKVAFSLAEKFLEDEEQRDQLEQDKNAKVEIHLNKKMRILPCIEGQSHAMFPNASHKISFKNEEARGRFAIANKQIGTGETLVVEQPYAACLLPEMFGTHCHHCFERLFAPTPCPDCSNIAFCNPSCRDAALSSYHKYECKYLDLMIGSGMSILSHTALRMVTQNPLSKCLEIYKNRSKEKVYSLCTNGNKRSAEDFLQRALMAVFLLRCLQKSGYFGDHRRDGLLPTADEYCVGALLLFHLQMLQFNAHEIYETRTSVEHKFKGSITAYIGVAVYPTVALFNHDCYPAVTRHFVGKAIVIKASRPLLPNDEIAENYGPIFTRKSLAERQRSLSSRYWFNCRCQPCEFNWPALGAGLEEVSKRVRCTSKKCCYCFTLPLSNETLTCPKCKNTVSLTEHVRLLNWCEEQYQHGFDEMKAAQPEKAIEILCEAIEVFHRVSRPPHRETHLAQETLQICVASFGNVSQILVKKT